MLGDEDIAIFHTADGYLVRSGLCKHNGFKLELCNWNGDVIQCPLHLWQYRLSTGKGIKPSYTQLEVYEVELRGEEIWVRPSEAGDDPDQYDTSGYQW